MNSKLKTKEVDHLFDAVLTLESKEECYKFFEDVCTINELLSILENVSAIGAPVPGFLQALLKKLKVHTEDTGANKLPGEEDNNNE